MLELATGDVVSSFLHARGEVSSLRLEESLFRVVNRPRRRIFSDLPALSQQSTSSTSRVHPVARALVVPGGAAVAALRFCGGRELCWPLSSWRRTLSHRHHSARSRFARQRGSVGGAEVSMAVARAVFGTQTSEASSARAGSEVLLVMLPELSQRSPVASIPSLGGVIGGCRFLREPLSRRWLSPEPPFPAARAWV